MALSGSVKTGEMEGRSLTFKWTAKQDVQKNTSTITWSVVGSGSYTSGGVSVREVKVTIDGTTVYSNSSGNQIMARSGQVLASGTKTFTHNADGKKTFKVYIGAAIYYQWLINTSNEKTFTLTTIQRASTVTAPTFTLGQAGDLKITKANSNFTHTLTYQWNVLKGTIVEKSSDTTISWTPPLEEFCNVMTEKASGTGLITCVTYNGDTQLGTTTATFIGNVPDSVKPSVLSWSIEPDNSSNETINEWGLYVSGFSKAKITATSEGMYGSKIRNYTISQTGTNIATVNGEPLSWISDTLSSSGNTRYAVCSQDSRGRTSSWSNSQEITVYGYSEPSIIGFSVGRSEASATRMDIIASWDFSDVNGKNSITPRVMYKKKTSTAWTVYSGTITNLTKITLSDVFSEADSYDFKLIVTDAIGNSAEAEFFVSTIEVLLDFKAGGKALGVGKTAEMDNCLEMNPKWNLYTHGKEIVELIEDAVNPVSESVNKIADYIIAEGTSGVWTYRKWNSGTADCYLTEPYYISGDSGNLHITKSSWADGYEPTEGYFILPAYPFSFTKTPSVSINFVSTDGGDHAGDAMFIVSPDNSSSGNMDYKANPPRFKLWRGTQKTIGHPRFTCYAIGRWK